MQRKRPSVKKKVRSSNHSKPGRVHSENISKEATALAAPITEYIPKSLAMKTLIKKTTGNVTASSLDAGEALTERTFPFDTILQVIDDEVEILIDHQTYNMDRVESVIIPVHCRDVLRANMRFKVMCTVIKSLGGTVSIYTV